MLAWLVQMSTCFLKEKKKKKKQEKTNKAHLNNSQTEFLQLGLCSLHMIHSAFKYGLQELDFPFDSFFLDLSFLCHLSSARRKDY